MTHHGADGTEDDEPDTGGEAESCEEPGGDCGNGEEKEAGGKGKADQAKAAVPAPAPQPSKLILPAKTRFMYPFNVRYAAGMLDLAGFVDGQEYTGPQIKELLIQNGYTEFADIEPEFHHAQATNTLVITIRGSVKGGFAGILRGLVERFTRSPHDHLEAPVSLMPATLLRKIEGRFLDTYREWGAEDRVLVYVDENGNLGAVFPEWTRHRAFVAGDVPLSFELNGHFWDLAFDLHSHHIMGISWSRVDNANERIRGPIFGVCSWRDGHPAWRFRRWLNPEVGFEDLSYADVVTDISVEVPMLETDLDG